MNNTITRDIFVGRQAELDKIRRAIESPQLLQVVNIQGEGGMGKTSLLTQVIREYKERSDLYVTDILDFFSTATHTRGGFLAALIEQFPSDFQAYRKARQDYDRVRLAGMPGRDIEECRQKASNAFRSDFADLTRSRKAVLLIDTFEVVQDALGDWMLGLMSEIKAEAKKKRSKGATFIIAGRRNKEWLPELQKRFDGTITLIELAQLDAGAVEELCQRIVEEGDQVVDPAEREKLNLLTEGRPLLLTLALDWRRREGVSAEHLTETTSKHTLAELQQMPADVLSKVHHTFEAELVAKFNQLNKPTDRVILLMSHVYKRFDADILAYLDKNISKDKAQDLLGEMKWWSFMKYDARTDTYQLHDKMRDMVSEHGWENQDPDGSNRRGLSAQMTRYYQQLLEEYDRSIERKIDERNKAAKRGDAQVQASARREEIALRAERNVLAAHYAYYDILADPQEGLLRCNEATPDDIWAFNMVGYALKKRERESALSKLRLQLPGYVTDMEQVRVLTVVDQNRKGALDLLEKLDDPQIFSRPELAKSTFQADVKIYQGINISYLPPLANVSQDAPPDLYALVHKWVGEKSPFERAVELIQEAVAILQEKKKLPLSELEQTALNSSFARAYSAQAYPLSRLGRLTEAADAHRDCITYASHGQLPETLSHARNDLGYIYVRLGKFAVAEDMIRRGLAIRERLGLAYFVALGYNTLGVLEFLHDRPHRGVPHCQEALSLFEELGDKRGIGLANLTLGKNKGRIGEVELDRDAFEAARRCYAKALEVFSTPDASGQLVEPARLAETYEWLGILDSMWGGIFLVEVGADPDEIAKHLAQADQYFQKAIQGYESAGRKLEQAIALERWARVYRDVAVHTRTSPQDKQEQFALAQARLSEAEAIALKQAPEVELRPLSEGGSPSIPDTRHPEYRLVLGKVERLRGRLAFDQVLEAQADDERQRLLKETASHFTLACAYSEQFSKEASELGTALRQATERLWSLKYPEMGAFLEYVLAIQKDYGLSAYTSLPERIQDVASIEG